MSEGKERAEARLSNLEAIEPLLGSLRVLSLSTMQMALNRQASLTEYAERFSLVAAQVRSLVGDKSPKREVEERFDYRPVEQSQVLAVIGSSRGICGQYNKQLARLAAERMQRKEELPTQVLAFGVRVQRALTQVGVKFEAHETLGQGSMPAYDMAAHLLREWTACFQDGTLAKVEILSFRKRAGNSSYSPVFTTLLPASGLETLPTLILPHHYHVSLRVNSQIGVVFECRLRTIDKINGFDDRDSVFVDFEFR